MTLEKSENNKPIIYIDREIYNKIKYICDNVEIEVSGFGILESKNPLKITDFVIIKQESTIGTTDMDDDAIADFVEDWTEVGWQPWQLQRAWIHTHPSGVTNPSSVDMDTFKRCLGTGDFGIMIIFVKSGEIICNIHINSPIEVIIPAKLEVREKAYQSWIDEVNTKVSKKKSPVISYFPTVHGHTGYGQNFFNQKKCKTKKITGKDISTKGIEALEDMIQKRKIKELEQKRIRDMTDEEWEQYDASQAK